jgi:hypothetical protein
VPLLPGGPRDWDMKISFGFRMGFLAGNPFYLIQHNLLVA